MEENSNRMNDEDNSNNYDDLVEQAMNRSVMLYPLVAFWEKLRLNFIALDQSMSELEKSGAATQCETMGVMIPYGDANLAYQRLKDATKAAVANLKQAVSTQCSLTIVAFPKEPRRSYESEDPEAVSTGWTEQREEGLWDDLAVCGKWVKEALDLFRSHVDPSLLRPEGVDNTPVGTEWVSGYKIRKSIDLLVAEDGYLIDGMSDILEACGIIQGLDYDPTNKETVKSHARMKVDRMLYELDDGL